MSEPRAEDRGRILIVDDNPTNLLILDELLRKHYTVRQAECGEACLELLPSFRRHIVLLDIMMPGMDGYETCRRIKASPGGHYIQVMLVSGKGSTPERLQGYQSQADDYVVKPFDHEELVARVHIQCRVVNSRNSLVAVRERPVTANGRIAGFADTLEDAHYNGFVPSPSAIGWQRVTS